MSEQERHFRDGARGLVCSDPDGAHPIGSGVVVGKVVDAMAFAFPTPTWRERLRWRWFPARHVDAPAGAWADCITTHIVTRLCWTDRLRALVGGYVITHAKIATTHTVGDVAVTSAAYVTTAQGVPVGVIAQMQRRDEV